MTLIRYAVADNVDTIIRNRGKPCRIIDIRDRAHVTSERSVKSSITGKGCCPVIDDTALSAKIVEKATAPFASTLSRTFELTGNVYLEIAQQDSKSVQ